MRTSTVKPSVANWYVVDAKDQVLGRLSTRIAHVLRGKHKVEWSPHQVMSDHVIVINAGGVVLTGKKSEQKEYIRHSGYLGHLKRIPYNRLVSKDPTKVIVRAVKGMLPRNRLRPLMIKHLHVFKDDSHIHAPQKPQPLASIFDTSASPTPSS